MSEKKMIATREGFGKEIVALGKENPDILVVDIDIGKSCKTGEFRKELPDQYINVGIAEQNGAGVAAGLKMQQLIDDGEITDSHGRKVNFENTVIVMTSNAGSERKEGTVGFGHTVNEQNRDRAMKALGEFLRPEFLNRVDEVICFNRLDEKNFAGIARIMLDELQKSLEDKGLHFTWDEDVEDYLVKKSYSATYGARNLRRTIQKELEDVMAAQIIDSYEHPVTQIHASMEVGKLVVRSL